MNEQLNLIDTIAAEERFSTFANLLDISRAASLIAVSGDYTVFAPTNEAFDKFPDGVLDELLRPERLTDLEALVAYHILPGKMLITQRPTAPANKRSLTGKVIRFVEKDGPTVNEAEVQSRNIEASNGVVHAIDAVLSPPIAAGLMIEHADVITAVKDCTIL